MLGECKTYGLGVPLEDWKNYQKAVRNGLTDGRSMAWAMRKYFHEVIASLSKDNTLFFKGKSIDINLERESKNTSILSEEKSTPKKIPAPTTPELQKKEEEGPEDEFVSVAELRKREKDAQKEKEL